jgi:steroid delta-isomerase-like uncharacterized protein
MALEKPPAAAAAGGTMTREEMVALFDRRQEAYDDLDADRLAEDYAEDCIVDSPLGGTHTGRTTIAQVIRQVFQGFPDLKYRQVELLIDGDRVAQIAEIEGTDIGGFLGTRATGKGFKVLGVFLYEFRDRRIVREHRVYDYTGVLVQIGAMKAKPI